MAPLHRVYFLGNLIQDPEMGYAPNGTAVARWGLAVPTRLRQGDTWHADVCCINVVAFGRQAETVGASLRKGRTVLIEGRVQWRRGAPEGPSRCTQEVIAERIQVLARPREGTRAAAGVGRSSSGARPAEVPPTVDAWPVSGHGERRDTRDARDVRPRARG
jgi:single-strand DNA-binding protein